MKAVFSVVVISLCSSVKTIPHSKEFTESLLALDTIPEREPAVASVVYWAKGASTTSQIFSATQDRSATYDSLTTPPLPPYSCFRYEEFLRNLGKSTEVHYREGYNAELRAKYVDVDTFLYYEDMVLEYHYIVSTLMGTEFNQNYYDARMEHQTKR